MVRRSRMTMPAWSRAVIEGTGSAAFPLAASAVVLFRGPFRDPGGS
jgi:hypothetical protein